MKTAVCSLIMNGGTTVLCVTRKDNKSDWGLPGGKSDDNESPVDTAVRETAEETGYIIDVDEQDFFEDTCGDFLVRTYKCGIISQDSTLIKKDETGLVDFRPVGDLLASSFGEYNLKCFAYFKLLGN